MIESERLVLRPLRTADAGWITQEISVPEVHRWLTTPPMPYTRADGEEFVAKFADDRRFGVITTGGEPLGVVSITANAHRAGAPRPIPELGYWLKMAAWGQGYMTEAAQAFVAAFRATYQGPIDSGYLTGNDGSRRVLEKLGAVPMPAIQRRSEFFGRDVTVHRVRLPDEPHAL